MVTLKGVTMNKLPIEKRAQILGMMVEGVSIRSITRLLGVSKNTVVKLLVDAGEAFMAYQDKTLRNLPCKNIQCDEIWSFVYGKQKNLPEDKKDVFGYGDVWTWTALCADTKLIAGWMVGDRSAETAKVFLGDLAERLSNRVQLTTDGHKAYLTAVDGAFGTNVDYGMLVKIFAGPRGNGQERRYSSGICCGAMKETICGKPDENKISTSFVERQNLSMRMGMRRFTRLTNAFSKKLENHMYALAIYFMHYNFVRIHQTLRVTPAMEAGITPTLMTLEDMVRVIDDYENEK